MHQHLNIEIKSKCANPEKIREILLQKNADFKGTDHQIDTYFNCPDGRLKLREGTIENNLIHYKRHNQEGPKRSDVILYKSDPKSSLKSLLTAAMGVLTVVDKQREIYFLENVKFHIDQVADLGSFIEIEAIDFAGTYGEQQLIEQCNQYIDLFGLDDSDFVAVSYSDLLIAKELKGKEEQEQEIS